MYRSEDATLSLHKESLRGIAQDYVIHFSREERDFEKLIPITLDIVSQLMDSLVGRTIAARLVAVVNYKRNNSNDNFNVFYPSYSSEKCTNVTTFLTSHMLRIVERMDSFNQRGSNLYLNKITEIHLHLNIIE